MSIRAKLKKSIGIQESGAVLYHHQYYGNRNGINNRDVAPPPATPNPPVSATEAKDDDLHKHVGAMKDAGFKVTDYRRLSANTGHLAAGPRGRNRMDKGRATAQHQQGFYTDPHLSLRFERPSDGKKATTWMYKGRSKSSAMAGPQKGDFKTRDDVATMIFDTPSMITSPETGNRFKVNAFTADNPKQLARKLSKMKPQESLQELAAKPQPKAGNPKGGAPAKGGKKPNPDYAPPELPGTLDPAAVHNYYMSMADYHDKRSWMNKRIAGLKPLWSNDRTMHDDRHLFHKAMRDGFAQKALAVDLAAPMDGQGSGFAGMKESIQESSSPERIQVAHDVHTLEEFVEKYGRTPLEALRTGQIKRFTIIGERHGKADNNYDEEKPGCVCDQCGRTVTHKEYSSGATTCCKNGSVVPEEDFGKTFEEAFSGTAPTGALNTVNQNKSASAKPLPMQSPFPSQVQHKTAVGKVADVPKLPGVPKVSEATLRVLQGESLESVLNSLRKF